MVPFFVPSQVRMQKIMEGRGRKRKRRRWEKGEKKNFFTSPVLIFIKSPNKSL